jgi:hypothetical protein
VSSSLGERRARTMRGLVQLGRASEAVQTARYHLHAAMAITPLGEDHIATLGEIAEVLTLVVDEYRVNEQAICDEVVRASRNEKEKENT